MTWKEWLEEKQRTECVFPSERVVNQYALISRYPEVLAIFREAMKGKPGPKPVRSSNSNVIGIEASQGNDRAYSGGVRHATGDIRRQIRGTTGTGRAPDIRRTIIGRNKW